MVEMVEVLEELHSSVWKPLAGLLGTTTAVSFRSGVLQAVHTSLAYLDQELFQKAVGLPWTLGQGDVEANLGALMRGPVPKEAVSWKIYKLLQEGPPPLTSSKRASTF